MGKFAGAFMKRNGMRQESYPSEPNLQRKLASKYHNHIISRFSH
jgi:hypothetical protein